MDNCVYVHLLPLEDPVSNLQPLPLPPQIGKPATRGLAAHGIVHLEQLTGHREEDLLQMHGVGPKALQILKMALKEQGLALLD